MRRFFIFLEFLCLFGPAVLLLGLGLLWLPVTLVGAVGSVGWRDISQAALIIGGTWGLISATNLAFHLIFGIEWPGKPIQLFGLGFGVLACGFAMFVGADRFSVVVFGAPIVATVHFVVLARYFSE